MSHEIEVRVTGDACSMVRVEGDINAWRETSSGGRHQLEDLRHSRLP
jgi:hypothetical protein